MSTFAYVSIFLIFLLSLVNAGVNVINLYISKRTVSRRSIVLSEMAVGDKVMDTGTLNVRSFDVVSFQRDINYDAETSTITLKPGTYRIRGFSKVVVDPNSVSTTDAPGYCVIRTSGGEILASGSVANAKYGQLSHLDVVLKLTSLSNIQMAHQVGGNETTYLQRGGNESTNHLFANLIVERDFDMR